MSDGSENVVFLAFRNPDAPTEVPAAEVLYCKTCRNKTWIAMYYAGSKFPMLRCACCSAPAGSFGWIDDSTSELPGKAS